MPDPVKTQILDHVISDLQPLITGGTFRSLTREADRLRDTKVLPALMVIDGPETTHDKGATVWTCRFLLEIRIVFAKPREAGPTKDTLVAEVQKKIEADLTLGGLGLVLNAGNEEPTAGPDSNQTHQTKLRYTIEYTRKIGDPYLSS